MIDLQRDMAKAAALAQAGKTKPAIALLERVVTAAPTALAARYSLALTLLTTGRYAEALPHLDRILEVEPKNPAALYSKARGLMALDRAEEALPLLRPLAEAGDPDSLLATGNAFRSLNRIAEAAEAYRTLTQRAPGHLGGHVNLGLLLVATAPEAAIPALEHSVRIHPGIAELHALLGQALLRQGRYDEAAERLNLALKIDPNLQPAKGHLLRACRETADWDQEEALFAEIRAGLSAPSSARLTISTQDALFYPFDGNELRKIAAAEAAFRVPGRPRPVARPRTTTTSPPLTVAYLSPDFREHATMHLAGDLFGHHDRARVRVVAASVGPDDGSDWRRRIAADCDLFLDLSTLGDRAAANRLAAEGVNILVDMSVYTRHARPGIAALRPAPVQIAWLGLAASSSAPWIDYAIVDPVLVPPPHRNHFSEALIFLPHGYQANLAWKPLIAPPPRSELGLPDDGVVFCSFNGHRKLDRATFSLWMRVLAAVPGSVLWQLAPPPIARTRLEQAAIAAGIAPERLIWAPRLPWDEHLKRLPAADLFLDALVCGAHTTAADALRMGVPLLTCAGPRLASRVAASLLESIGLPELITPSPEGMFNMARELALAPARRAALRARLATLLPQAAAFDPRGFARDLETAYEQVWMRASAGKPVRDIGG
ncbi:O-linked N-acetylglucosamine transferase, SPINDLY family protein [Magnetospirillum molischianum]|uniref:protein O-GlcNAc transferase n=1 Tax=Magnetospirillum molischianum DSM 120 TaxID=1150626 RepID=H8FRB9_MAGML|nr:tetratricopeptide repeat protein [Magnetospirillum molischianum]CCG40907.1 Predicted O-linked N-acetylglucosamine transferase [Magnetospirillum molischianum DSM 120]